MVEQVPTPSQMNPEDKIPAINLSHWQGYSGDDHRQEYA